MTDLSLGSSSETFPDDGASSKHLETSGLQLDVENENFGKNSFFFNSWFICLEVGASIGSTEIHSAEIDSKDNQHSLLPSAGSLGMGDLALSMSIPSTDGSPPPSRGSMAQLSKSRDDFYVNDSENDDYQGNNKQTQQPVTPSASNQPKKRTKFDVRYSSILRVIKQIA